MQEKNFQVIGVDCGRNGVKAVSGFRRVFIPAVVGEWRRRKISDGGEWEIDINGEKYFVGSLAQTESRHKREMVTKSKIHPETKILTLAAIALLAVPGNEIRLISGVPIEQHTDEEKYAYIRLLDGRHIVTVNGIRKEFTLDAQFIGITFEGAGAYYSESLVGNKTMGRCRVIDIGSRTINALTLLSSKFSDLDSTTLNYGCIDLIGGDDEQAEQFARRIFADLSKRWMDYSTSDSVLLTGGGALLLEDQLKKHYRQARVISDPVFANALGYFRMGEKRWQK